MSIVSGPKVSDEGLVLHYDMGNTEKSFKGKPTVNLAANNFFNGNGNFTINETIEDIMPDGKPGVSRLLRADTVVDPNRTVSIGSYNLTAGVTYTLSFYAKNIDCTGFGGNLYSPGLSRSIGGITYPTIVTDRWTRVITTFTVPDEGIDPVSVAPQVFRDAGYGDFKLCWLQLEESDISTPYVNGTRSNTESLVDLQRQNTLTSLDLVYTSENEFSFDGSTSYIQSNNARSTLGITDTYSVEVVFKRTVIDSGRIIIGGQGFNWGLLTTTNGFRANNWYSNDSGSSWNIIATTEYGLPINTWVHAVGTFNHLGNMTLYANGNLISTADMSARTNYWRDSTICVGGWTFAGYRVNAQIPIARFYGKELTADKVRDNFEAARSRFGI